MQSRESRAYAHFLRFVATLALGAGGAALIHCASPAATVCECPTPDGSVRAAFAACNAGQADAGCRTTIIPGEGPLPPPELSASLAV